MTLEEIHNDPLYQFMLEQCMKQLNQPSSKKKEDQQSTQVETEENQEVNTTKIRSQYNLTAKDFDKLQRLRKRLESYITMLNSDLAELDSLLEKVGVPASQPRKRANLKAERRAYYSNYFDKKE